MVTGRSTHSINACTSESGIPVRGPVELGERVMGSPVATSFTRSRWHHSRSSRPAAASNAANGGCPSLQGAGDDVEVSLIGQIAAGVPVDAAETAEETFLLSRRLVGHGALFMLRVKADSMTGAAITDDDLPN